MLSARAVEGERRDDGVDAGAVRQAGVHHRAGLVDAPADLRHDAVDDLQQVVVVAELDVGLLQLAAALDVDLVRPVDQDVADRRVLEQHLQRAEAEGLVEHFVDELLALHAVEERVLGVAQVLDDPADVAPEGVRVQVVDPRQVEPLDQLAWICRFSSSKFFVPPPGRRPCWCSVRRGRCSRGCSCCSASTDPAEAATSVHLSVEC